MKPDEEKELLDFYNKRVEKIHDKVHEIFKVVDIESKTNEELGFNHALLNFVLDEAIFLYALGLHSHVVIELYGIIEYFLLRAFKEEFPNVTSSSEIQKIIKNKGFSSVITFLLRKQKWKASELASIFKEIGVLDKNDVKIIEELEDLRNLIAHKNVEKMSKHPKIMEKFKFFEIDSSKFKLNSEMYFMPILKILRKLYLRHTKLKN